MKDAEALDPYLERLRDLPFAREVTAAPPTGHGRNGFDAVIRIKTPTGLRRLRAQVKKTHLGYELAAHLASEAARTDEPMIVLAPYVAPPLGRYLEEHGLNYVDSVGNCFLSLGSDYVARLEGRRRPPRDPGQTTLRAPSYQVLFALLAHPELAAAPVRVLAEKAGVGKTAAAEMLRRLEHEGHVGRTRTARLVLEHRRLLERWLTGYADVLRPSLFIGRYHTPDQNPGELETRCESALGEEVRWAWGGGAAAMRLTGYYRGEQSVLCIEDPPHDLARRLKAAPSKQGPLTILRTKGPLMLEGAKPRTVHPLLVYAEMLALPNERATEAAQEVREKFLELPK